MFSLRQKICVKEGFANGTFSVFTFTKVFSKKRVKIYGEATNIMGLGGVAKRLASWVAPSRVVVSGNARNPGVIAITFDDGPHPENTPRILDLLDESAVRATFFLQGSMAEIHPTLVRDIVRRGHQIGNHGYAHLDARAVSTKLYVSDVLHCQAILDEIAGMPLQLNFRPPFGHVALRSTVELLLRGFRFVFWSLDSRDSFLPDSKALVDNIKEHPIASGSIVLLHDDYAHTVDALPQLFEVFRRHSLKSVSINELIFQSDRSPVGVPG